MPGATRVLWAAASCVVTLVSNQRLGLLQARASLPFTLRLDNPSIAPYLAPGLALSAQYGVQLKVNLIGGCFFELGDRVRLFTELAIRLVNGTYVDLLGGVLVAL